MLIVHTTWLAQPFHAGPWKVSLTSERKPPKVVDERWTWNQIVMKGGFGPSRAGNRLVLLALGKSDRLGKQVFCLCKISILRRASCPALAGQTKTENTLMNNNRNVISWEDCVVCVSLCSLIAAPYYGTIGASWYATWCRVHVMMMLNLAETWWTWKALLVDGTIFLMGIFLSREITFA